MRARMIAVRAATLMVVLPMAGGQVATTPDPPTPAGGDAAETAELLAATESQQEGIAKSLEAIEAHGRVLENHLAEIEKTLDDWNSRSFLSTLLPAATAAAAALLGVFLGGYVNERLQRERLDQEMAIARDKATHEKQLAEAEAQRERELSEKHAKLQIAHAVVDWELKQLSLLYGPMRALLGQSLALYRQMNQTLERADSTRFRFAETQPDVDGRVFQIETEPGKWERFRTVLHISEVYGKGLGVETYFDEIVSIGVRIVGIIEDKAGYARPNQRDLMTVFGKYLAHFAVLKHLHGDARRKLSAGLAMEEKASLKPTPKIQVDLSAVFPQELHVIINDGFDAITGDLEEWRRAAS